jgi:hypothetical protein
MMLHLLCLKKRNFGTPGSLLDLAPHLFSVATIAFLLARAMGTSLVEDDEEGLLELWLAVGLKQWFEAEDRSGGEVCLKRRFIQRGGMERKRRYGAEAEVRSGIPIP